MEEGGSVKLRVKYFLSGIAAAFLIFAAVYFLFMYLPFQAESPSRPDSLGAQKKVKEIQRIIERNYLGEIDQQKQTDYMYLGMVAGLEDPYSVYYTREQYEELQKTQEGSYTGIGITIVQNSEDGKIYIQSCVQDSPAAAAGIQEGDCVTAVNGVSTEGMTTSEVVEQIGSGADQVVLSVVRNGGAAQDITVEIGMVEMVSVNSRMLDQQVGYIQITEFTGVTSEQFSEAYETLNGQGMQKLIIDLRDNPGGLVSAVCDTLRQILPEGIIVYTEDKNGSRNEELCEGETPIQMPLAVLVNESSASASEIFAGAVKDYGIGTLVGTKTFGKGIVQDLFQLSDGSVLKLTVSHYFTPKGNNIHGSGIAPDVEIDRPEGDSGDAQLEKALEVLEEQ